MFDVMTKTSCLSRASAQFAKIQWLSTAHNRGWGVQVLWPKSSDLSLQDWWCSLWCKWLFDVCETYFSVMPYILVFSFFLFLGQCSWRGPYVDQSSCKDFSKKGIDSRFLQSVMYEGQRNDIDPLTGDRWSTSFPNVSSTPEETFWWTQPAEMPGAEQGANVSGFETTYARVRKLSGMGTVFMPLYNYFPGRDEDHSLGSYIGLENDGMVRRGSGSGWRLKVAVALIPFFCFQLQMLGYVGCNSAHADYAYFQSTEANG